MVFAKIFAPQPIALKTVSARLVLVRQVPVYAVQKTHAPALLVVAQQEKPV